MSYCRVSDDSDVYLYHDGREWNLSIGGEHGRYTDPLLVLGELVELRKKGAKIPDHTFKRLCGEIYFGVFNPGNFPREYSDLWLTPIKSNWESI